MNIRTAIFVAATSLTFAFAVVGCNDSPQAVTSTPSDAASNVSDMDVTEHVKTALRQSDLLKSFDINVLTLKGDVRLVGVLDTQAQVDEAIKIARAADGTHAIHDELSLKK